MRAFCLNKLRAKLSYYLGSDLQNFRRTSCKLHDASSTAPFVDYASTIERKPLWISRADTQLCESDSKAQISDMLKNIDRDISNIFESSERLQLKSEAEKLLFYLRSCDYDVDDISNLIASYAFSIPSFEVEHVIGRIENLHDVLEILPASSMYEKLILYCCGKDRVEVAINVVDKMCESGFTLSSHVMQSVLETCSETDQHYWVFEIYYHISRRPHQFELNGKICRLLVHCCVVMKDFECAYKMINELPKKYFKYKTTMYNAIMAEYVFEKNISGGLRVLKHMREANVKLDSYTFSYLIGNCRTKEEIKKVWDEEQNAAENNLLESGCVDPSSEVRLIERGDSTNSAPKEADDAVTPISKMSGKRDAESIGSEAKDVQEVGENSITKHVKLKCVKTEKNP